jgi:hypothetical protein
MEYTSLLRREGRNGEVAAPDEAVLVSAMRFRTAVALKDLSLGFMARRLAGVLSRPLEDACVE